MTGLKDHRHRMAGVFSGGLKRRLNLAIGLLDSPEFLILDEPTVGIDPQSRHFILEAIQNLNHDGMTILYTSHYMEEVEQLCDTIAIMDHGRILAAGSLTQLLRSDAFVAIETEENLGFRYTPLPYFFVPGTLKLSGQHLQAELREPQLLPDLVTHLRDHDCHIRALDFGRQTLESLFFQLTHTSLRD
jgi:ABC-2 type transport system ATP-binding protein